MSRCQKPRCQRWARALTTGPSALAATPTSLRRIRSNLNPLQHSSSNSNKTNNSSKTSRRDGSGASSGKTLNKTNKQPCSRSSQSNSQRNNSNSSSNSHRRNLRRRRTRSRSDHLRRQQQHQHPHPSHLRRRRPPPWLPSQNSRGLRRKPKPKGQRRTQTFRWFRPKAEPPRRSTRR